MKFFDKNSWLNLVIGITGFYFVFSIMQIIMGRYGTKVVAATPAASHITGDYYWVISFVVALILALTLILLFCKPRAPLFVFLGILFGGALGMFYSLYTTVMNLDKYFRTDGLAALGYLIPHLVILLGALIGLYFSWISNRIGGNTE